MTNKVCVAGVGMVPFCKPGASEPYDTLAAEAAFLALKDAGIDFDLVQQAYAGYVYGDSTAGQKALYKIGMTGIPIINVNNNCSTGSSALFLARQAVESGAAECVLALGFEQMNPGALGAIFNDRPTPFENFDQECEKLVGMSEIPLALRYFGGAGLEHMNKYGTTLETFAKVRAKASNHAVNNPLALFRKRVSPEEVLASPVMWPNVMTRLMACPPTCGGAAAIITSEEFARKNGLRHDVQIVAQAMTTDYPSTFESHSMMKLVGYDMTAKASQAVYEASGIGPDEVDVVELHDCFAQNELVSYEALGLCEEGGAEKFINDADNTYGGQIVTN
ncbi:MAG: thiolase C-terminal domain-containing protein, partial [Gammaproteobacteria bacterium]